MRYYVFLFTAICSFSLLAQNPLIIPPALSGTNFQLTLQEGTSTFFPGITTNTLGANGNLLGPTLILQQGDFVNIEVENQLMDTTTIHWHGLHVAPEHDGGPHTTIPPMTTWNPQFTVLDKAGTYWYHPHLHMHTNEHVSKGIAGMILVRDAEETALNLPVTYGVDEFPLVLQTKAFDAAGQIVVTTNLDTTVLVNGTRNAHLDLPAQVVRLRLLNGASMRTMEIGFSDNRAFHIIGTDGGLLAAPVLKTRYRLAPGQRLDILVDLNGATGQNFSLMSYGAELPNANYGAAQPGMGPGATGSLIGYTANPLNGANYVLLDLSVVAQTANPVTAIPVSLANFTPIPAATAQVTRTLTFTSAGTMGNLNGPFVINGMPFDMHMINYTIPLDNVEIWSLTNQTPIAHPFHIHDVQFFILDINGVAPSPEMAGYHDVVLVPAGNGNVRFIAVFNDHSNDSVPYMYHCHMLTHEDDGMMGQFLVVNPSSSVPENETKGWKVYPNPSDGMVNIAAKQALNLSVFTIDGQLVHTLAVSGNSAALPQLSPGIYLLKDEHGNCEKLIVN